MSTQTVRIVDDGCGPKIEGHRLTVMDVFYYLYRGCDFEFIHGAMPSLTREQFDAVVEYVNQHYDELAEEDRLVEESIKRQIAEQEAKGLRPHIDTSIPLAVRLARLKEKMQELKKQQRERDGGRTPR